ncbi:hypothetical protein K439DRAFT_750708 [Ramaria rubella]|nr:hypothetical protein K439DRAFT_750708 [Ramaria rubella]
MRAGITPDFIFISLSSHDILKIANITSSSLSEYLLETMVPYWPESPVSHTDINGNLQLRLGGDVWGAKGNTAIMFICKLFMVLAQEGFGYLATVDNHPMKAPRLVFASVPPESHPHYFMISFSLSRRTVTIIDAPAKLSVLLGAALRQSDSERPNEAATTPRRSEDGWIHQGVYEVVTSHSTGRQDIALLMGGALKLIAAEGWRFEASVPFGKGGFLGLGGRREVWMFRREPTSPSRLPRPEGRKRKGI